MMNNTRIIPLIFGFFIIYIGVIILLNSLGFHIDGGSIFPLLLLLLGYYFLKKQKKVLGYIFTIFGSLILLESWFGIDIGDIIGFFIAIGFIYFGYRMIRKKNSQPFASQDSNTSQTNFNEKTNYDNEPEDKDPDSTSAEFTDFKQSHQFNSSADFNHSYRIITPRRKHSLIGSCSFTQSRWELTNMDIWHGIGEVKIDLSHANIPDQKSTILINGWIGDVDIYIPYDLEVAIIARVSVGEIDIFGNKEGGLNRSTTIETTGYRTAVKRVEIVINLFVGDIDVNYL